MGLFDIVAELAADVITAPVVLPVKVLEKIGDMVDGE